MSLSLDHVDGVVCRDEPMPRHATPGGEVCRCPGVTRHELESLPGRKLLHPGSQLEDELSASHFTRIEPLHGKIAFHLDLGLELSRRSGTTDSFSGLGKCQDLAAVLRK